MVDITSTSSPEELRLCTQISLIGYLVPCSGEVLVLQTSWNQAGIAANHKELFSPCDWGPTTLTVTLSFRSADQWDLHSSMPHLFVLISDYFPSHLPLRRQRHCSPRHHFWQILTPIETYSTVSIRFSKGDNMSVVRLLRHRLVSEPAAGILSAIARILSFLSTQPQIVSPHSVSGCPSDLLPILEQ